MTEKDCGLADARTIDALIELDAHLKREAQRQMDGAVRNRDHDERRATMRHCSKLLEQARGVRMAIELAKGGKLLCGVIVPASTLAETRVASRTENVEGPT